MSSPSTPETRQLVETLQQGARWHEREAAALRRLVAKIENPPDGVTVELHGWPHPRVVFVGPRLDTRKAAA